MSTEWEKTQDVLWQQWSSYGTLNWLWLAPLSWHWQTQVASCIFNKWAWFRILISAIPCNEGEDWSCILESTTSGLMDSCDYVITHQRSSRWFQRGSTWSRPPRARSRISSRSPGHTSGPPQPIPEVGWWKSCWRRSGGAQRRRGRVGMTESVGLTHWNVSTCRGEAWCERAVESAGGRMYEKKRRQRREWLLITHFKYTAVSADRAVSMHYDVGKRKHLSKKKMQFSSHHSLGYTVKRLQQIVAGSLKVLTGSRRFSVHT